MGKQYCSGAGCILQIEIDNKNGENLRKLACFNSMKLLSINIPKKIAI